MKKAILIVACLFVPLLLCSCQPKEQNDMPIITKSNKTVTLINGVTDADIWILPQTEENMKTTLWGTATASKVKTGESRPAPLCEPGDDGLYLFRMIDTDHFYYSVSGLTLQANWTVRIKETDSNTVILEVTDENSRPDHTYEVFSARL